MIPRIEHIGSPSAASLAKRLRRWLSDLFGSRYAQLLERELLQTRLDKDRQIAELRADRDRLLEALMAVKSIPMRVASLPVPGAADGKTSATIQTNWQRLQAEAIAKNAADEEKERQTEAVKEN
jgi:hypothetical protein